MGSYSKYNKNYSNNKYQNNKHYKDDDSDYEYTKAEVERNLILCNRLDFNYKKYEVYKAYVAFTDNCGQRQWRFRHLSEMYFQEV